MQRFPQFRGHLIHYSTTLGHRMVSLLQRFVIERFHRVGMCVYGLRITYNMYMYVYILHIRMYVLVTYVPSTQDVQLIPSHRSVNGKGAVSLMA